MSRMRRTMSKSSLYYINKCLSLLWRQYNNSYIRWDLCRVIVSEHKLLQLILVQNSLEFWCHFVCLCMHIGSTAAESTCTRISRTVSETMSLSRTERKTFAHKQNGCGGSRILMRVCSCSSVCFFFSNVCPPLNHRTRNPSPTQTIFRKRINFSSFEVGRIPSVLLLPATPPAAPHRPTSRPLSPPLPFRARQWLSSRLRHSRYQANV